VFRPFDRLRAGRLNNQAGVDNAWEQEKPEARKMLENAAREAPTRQVHIIPMLLRDALLGNLALTRTMAEKRHHRQHAQLLHTTYFLAISTRLKA